ncbi:MAG TPA: polynucleotide adenylyltransferase PcnB [Methylophilaceae bacterium]|nr:polynucleotide adenylyltransferase PcnB [Methylophilaceae bacterium]
MIKKFLNKVFKKRQEAELAINLAERNTPKTVARIPVKKHKINQDLISSAALKTCAGLQEAGYDAYIVGGAVRDLLLDFKPKDFDVATNAEPEDVRKIFRRSRIIGKRFRLVHVLWGRETIEVSTFRGHHHSNGDASVDDTGRILRDNIFGSMEEDAARRDFTANALYYNPTTKELLDFHEGVADVKARLLRMIGEPTTRYQEDPVRMLRAVRLSAKLGLKIDKATQKPIAELADLLQDVPPSRLFDEMLKLFLSGHAIESINILRAQHLHHGLLPLLDVVLEQPLGEKFVMLALKNTDDRIMQGKSSNPSFLFATLLWHEVLKAWQENQKHIPLFPALYQAMDEVIQIQAKKLAIHNRFVSGIKEIWAMQPRFEQRAGKRPFALLSHPRYRAGYDFMLLRCESGEISNEIGEWWTTFAHASSDQRTAMLLPNTAPKKRRRRQKRKPTANKAADSA